MLNVRTVAAAAALFADIRAFMKLGMAMAAIIMTGNTAMLMYPMISPARAMPAPFRRPRLLLMADRDRCPRMIAGIPAAIPKIHVMESGMERIPSTRLIVAFVSVWGSTGGSDAGDAISDGGESDGTPGGVPAGDGA